MGLDRPTFADRPAAKINLTLEVLGRRPDGYHELRSIFLRVGLTDRLTMSTGGADGADTLEVTGLPGAPAGKSNIVTRALDAIRARAEVPLPALDVALEKRIPVAAGLGGGSSDCASAIRLAQAAWGIGLSQAEELEIGASLGSDVPFFLSGAAAAWVTGKGEFVAQTGPVNNVALLLVTPGVALATADVFAAYDELGETRSDFYSELDLGNIVQEYARLGMANHLWNAAASLVPDLAAIRSWLEEATSRPWLMSGSGPTLFSIYPSPTQAAQDGRRIAADKPAALEDAHINAVDLVGPDPAWRYP